MTTIEEIAEASNGTYNIVYFYNYAKEKWVKLLIRNKWLNSSIERTTELVKDVDSIELAHNLNIPLRVETIAKLRKQYKDREENWTLKGVNKKI